MATEHVEFVILARNCGISEFTHIIPKSLNYRYFLSVFTLKSDSKSAAQLHFIVQLKCVLRIHAHITVLSLLSERLKKFPDSFYENSS